MIEMTPGQLMAAGYNIPTPAQVVLQSQEPLVLQEVLRVLPGKRIVAKASLGEGAEKKIVLAKLFFQQDNYKHEIGSYEALRATGIKTPALIKHHDLEKGGICYYEFLPDITTFDRLWHNTQGQEKANSLEKLLALYAGLYQAGRVQQDCHFGNFVIAAGALYCLDPAGCVTATKKQFLYGHLAELASQFPVQEESFVVEAICKYFRIPDIKQLQRNTGIAREKRKKNYLAKVFRDCTEVSEIRKNNLHILCRRDEMAPDLLAVMENPEAAIAAGKILKDGRSTTVASVCAGKKHYVIKRYHNKNAFTALRRSFGRGRADNNWYFAHMLRMLGIPTPKPVALVKISNSLFDYCGYYISEYIHADNAYNVFVKNPPTAAQIRSISEIFAIWKAVGIEHGDSKATNWLACNDGVMIVDLDAMREKHNPGNTDVERFLKDWQGQPALLSLFEKALLAGLSA